MFYKGLIPLLFSCNLIFEIERGKRVNVFRERFSVYLYYRVQIEADSKCNLRADANDETILQ